MCCLGTAEANDADPHEANANPNSASAIWVGIGLVGVCVIRLCSPKTTHQCDEPDESENDREIGQRVVDSGRVLDNQLGDNNEDDR